MNKVAIISDTPPNAISGIVRSISQTKKFLEEKGLKVALVTPDDFARIPKLPIPTYPEVKLALPPMNRMEKILKKENADSIHIATEGSLGLIARMVCLKNNWNFTTSYHTRWPQYVEMRIKPLKRITYDYLRWFHKPSSKVMVSTKSLEKELIQKRFTHIVTAPLGGVDVDLFKRNPHAKMPEGLKEPVFTYLGRIAPEKNLEAFLKCRLPGSKLVIGDGPDKEELESKYHGQALFVGYKEGQDIVDLLSISKVFVFPSHTDTLGLAVLEALSCGLPVAAYDVQGPHDIITNGVDGYLGEDLESNAIKCLQLNAQNCRNKALQFSWENSAQNFLKNLVTIN